MANETANGDATAETVQADAINLRREFESLWSAGRRPDIRDFLQLAPEVDRDDLLGDLLEIEFVARRRNRELLGLDEYRKRFPDQIAIVERQYNQFVKPHELEDYEILSLVGRGGMGVVYKARQVRLNRIVALKVLSERMLDDPQAVSRFEREMQLNGQLSHRNIVNAFDARKERGIYFLVTEFIEGVCLSDVIKLHPQIPVNDVCEIVRQVADGLEYARRRDVVHRDIKPSNLMLTPGGTIKILDFGLAKLQADHVEHEIHRDLSVPGRPFGTFDYTAPEQCKDPTTVDHRADIYSLGCTMYHLLAGQPPFGGPQFSSVFAKMTAHSSTPPLRIDQFRDDVPPEVVAIVERMMAKQRDERFATPGEVAAALTPLAVGSNLQNLLSDPGKTVTDAPTSAPANTVKDSFGETKKSSPSSARADGARRLAIRAAIERIKRRPRLLAAVSAGILFVSIAAILHWRGRQESLGMPVGDAIATLPGLDGNDEYNWWFNEIPWLIPQSRQRLVRWARDHDAADTTKLIEVNGALNGAKTNLLTAKLRKLATNLPDAAPDDGDSDFFGKLAGRLTVDPRTRREFVSQMNGVVGLLFGRAGQPVPASGGGVAAATEKLAAADCHLLAVIWHKLATLAPTGNHVRSHELTQDQLFELADAAYQSAIEKYRREKDHQLTTLCRSDRATMYYDRGRHEDIVDAQRDFRNIGADELISPFARIYALCREANISARLKQDPEAQSALRDAEKIADEKLPPDHPLRAFIADWAGWTAMDGLDYQRATEYFGNAWGLRQKIGQEKSEAAIHDKHGLALALQYAARASDAPRQRREQLKKSHDDFAQVIEDLSSLLDDKSPAYADLSLQKLLNLCERMRNALDRDADGYLFGDREYEIAAARYKKCLEFLDAHDGLADGAKALEATTTRYKLAIALSCSKSTDVKDAQAELGQADESFSRLLEGQRDRIRFLNAIAHSLCMWKESGQTVRDRIVQTLARPYAMNIQDQGSARCQLLLRDERLPLDLLVSVTNDQELESDAIKNARKNDAGDRTPPDDGAAKAQSSN